MSAPNERSEVPTEAGGIASRNISLFAQPAIRSAVQLTTGLSEERFDEVIEDEADQPLSFPIPPRLDPNVPAAVSEARGLRPAYDRGVERIGRSQVDRFPCRRENKGRRGAVSGVGRRLFTSHR